MHVRKKPASLRAGVTGNRSLIIIGIVLFAIIGVGLLTYSKADTPTVVTEVENGVLTNGASKVTDSSAANGTAVKFTTGAPATFTHPGIMLGRIQLDFVKAKIAAGAQPWTNAYNVTKGKAIASLNFVPKPAPVIQCAGNDSLSQPNCDDALNASTAAYTQSLLYYYSGNIAHANKAIQIMDAFANTTTEIAFDTSVYTNGLLAAAWGAENFTRAAEIIRYSNAGWPATSVAKFEALLTNAYLPKVKDGWKNGGANWQVSMADATMSIGVFTNNKATFDDGVADWRAQVPSIFYLETDTNPTYPSLVGKKAPIPPPNTNWAKPTITYENMQSYWFGANQFINGLGGETCRDISHTVFSFEAIANAAETARLQGIDLYASEKTRLTTAMEANARWTNLFLNGQPQPANWPCNKPFNLGGNGYTMGWEVMFNHYSSRGGISLPQTQTLINRIRPTGNGVHMNWETLTSPNTP